MYKRQKVFHSENPCVDITPIRLPVADCPGLWREALIATEGDGGAPVRVLGTLTMEMASPEGLGLGRTVAWIEVVPDRKREGIGRVLIETAYALYGPLRRTSATDDGAAFIKGTL